MQSAARCSLLGAGRGNDSEASERARARRASSLARICRRWLREWSDSAGYVFGVRGHVGHERGMQRMRAAGYVAAAAQGPRSTVNAPKERREG
jgi:hypothetical protein